MRLKLYLMSVIKKWFEGGKFPDKDRRSFPRLRSHYLIKYKAVGKTQELSFVRDVSAGGLLFFAKVMIHPGTILEMELNFPGYYEPVKILARVTRVRSLKRTGGFEIGTQFIEIEDKARGVIKDKIERTGKHTELNGKDL